MGKIPLVVFAYDTGLCLTSVALTRASDNTLLYQTQPAYDAANNVVSVQTSIAGATDTQHFCYDALNRLTWAGASGTPPCASLTPGTLTAAQYQQSDSYNLDSGLTSGSAGSYTYGNSSHPHAVTATSSGYSAAYDAAGNMTCRALTSATTCSGTQTGQQLSYDAQGRLTTWESQPNSPSQTASYLYDGAGTRVAMQTTVNGTTTLTAYIGSIEEVQTTGSTTTTTTYYTVQGKRIAGKVNGSLYYFGYDALGSQVAVLNSSGNLVGSQLYGPYGNSRYSNGTLPTSIGFTGQRADSVTGLDYYVARYYDPVVGQFLSADVVQGNAQGMDPYAYVGENPETKTDPTGERLTDGSPYDYAVVLPDTNGDGGRALIVYTPSNRAAPNLNDEWVSYTHINAQGQVDALGGWPENGRRVVQCAFDCNASGWALLGGAVVLNPEEAGLCAAAPEACVLGGIAAVIVAAILHAIQYAPPTTVSYSWVNKKTEDGTTVKVRKLTDKEVHDLEEFGQSFEDIKSEEGYPPNADIYVDKNGNYWIQPPYGEFLVPFP